MTRFGFTTCGPFSGINDALLAPLQERLAPLQADPFDAPGWVRSRRGLLGRNLVSVLRERGPAPFRDRDALWGAFYRTGHLGIAVRREARERARRGGHVFTLQTQSLFDA